MMRSTIFYFTASFPAEDVLERFLALISPDLIKYVELGLPSVNPRYDGPDIRGTHRIAIERFRKETLGKYSKIINDLGITPFLLAYSDDLERMGADFLHYLREVNFSGVIVPDLLVDHYPEARETIEDIQESLDFIPFFNPSTPDAVVSKISSITRSWVYYGLQPSTGIEVPYDLNAVSHRILELIPDREINFGFGIRNIEQAGEILRLGTSGIAIGSILVPMLRNNDTDAFVDFQQRLLEVQAGV